MNKKLYLLLSLLFTFSCDYKSLLLETKKETVTNNSILAENNPVNIDIKILNPDNKSKVEWYKKDDKTIVMKVGAQADILGTAVLKDNTKSSNVTWSSSDNTVAIVNNGKVTANKIGNATILAVSNVDSHYKGLLNIEVVNSANFSFIDNENINKVSKIESYISTSLGNQNNIKMKKNSSVSALSVVTLNDGTKNSNVIWESSDENIATVDEDGKITTNKIGITTIVSKYKLNPSFKSLITIEVSETIVGNTLEENKNIAILPYVQPTPIIIEQSKIPSNDNITNPTAIPTIIVSTLPQSTPLSGIVKGVIKNNETNLGESGVTVSVKEKPNTTITDSNGNFSLSGIEEGVYTLVISKDNFDKQELNINVIKNQTTNVPETIFVRKHWFSQVSGTSNELYDLKFINANEGWVVGDNVILHTTNGGTSWEKQNGNIPNIWRGIDFVDSKKGWIVGNSGKTLHTTDGGINWVLKVIEEPSLNEFYLNSVDFIDSLTGWAVGNILLNTTDGGNTWKRKEVAAYYAPAQRVQFINKNNGFISNGYITSDGGVNWEYNSGWGVKVSDIFMIDANNLFEVAVNFRKSTDGGVTWNTSSPSVSGNSIYFIDSQKGWIVEGYGYDIYKTLDGGTTWTKEILGDSSNPYLRRVQFTDSNNGWAVGGSGKILKY